MRRIDAFHLSVRALGDAFHQHRLTMSYNAVMAGVGEITRLLHDLEEGQPDAMDHLMQVVYDDLERMARAQLRRQFGDHADRVTLEPAALVNESYMRLVKQRATYDNRGHFFSIATRMMIRVLIDYRRRRSADKRGGDSKITLSFAEEPADPPQQSQTHEVDLDALDEAVTELEQLDPRKADVMKMRIVWGLTNDEIAEALDVSRPTIEREWRFAKAWLADRVSARSSNSEAQ